MKDIDKCRVLYVGQMKSVSSTCRLRAESLKKIVRSIDLIDSSHKTTMTYKICNKLFNCGLPIKVPDNSKLNNRLNAIKEHDKYDIIWVDKVLALNYRTLKRLKNRNPNAVLICYTSDNMCVRHNLSQNFLDCYPVYDYHITTKSHTVDEMKMLGARKVLLVDKSYAEDFHRPIKLANNERELFGGDIGFVGTWEQERMESILYLTRNGLKVKVYGGGKWKACIDDNPNLEIISRGLYNEDYVKALCSFKINLCFLRKINKDQQTARSMEIPAVEGVMLAERTDEHKRLFEEDKEAVYFSTDEELLEKCKYYLEHEEERIAIAKAGRQSCQQSRGPGMEDGR